ncbi:MAG: hypothetical protein PHF37_10400, partial [Phycisphaerae bacterium]|nr:hypothetical protein [Phycisphaerae bacterium]
DSGMFLDEISEPDQKQIEEHFAKYRDVYSGDFSEQNPYGFGYELPDRVRLEYIALKVEDVEKIVVKPSPDEVERFYQNNRERFVQQVPQDPNDPNSPKMERRMRFVEVERDVYRYLYQQRVNAKAAEIIDKVKTAAELDIEDANTTIEQLAAAAPDYTKIAEKTGNQYNIKLLEGKTGLLSAEDVASDPNMSSMFITATSQITFPLLRVVFAVEPLQSDDLGVFDTLKPNMFQSIGHVRSQTGNLFAVVRVIDAKKANVPESLDVTYSKATMKLDGGDANEPQIFSLREKVAEDVKRLNAMDVVRQKAGNFLAAAEKDGWDKAIEEFSKKLDEPNDLEIRQMSGVRRVSDAEIEMIKLQNASNPAIRSLLNQTRMMQDIAAKLYSLVPDNNDALTEPKIMEFKPQFSNMVIQKIDVASFYEQEYEQMRGFNAFRAALVSSQSAAMVFLNPDNIFIRSGFEWINQKTNTPTVQPIENDETEQ